jgi:hypothetical protein
MSYPNLSVAGAEKALKVSIPRLQKQRSEIPSKAITNRQNRVDRAKSSAMAYNRNVRIAERMQFYAFTRQVVKIDSKGLLRHS